MPFLTLGSDLLLGVPGIDAAHEALLQVLNNILDSVKVPATAAEGGEFVDRLLEAADNHFHQEDALIARIGYPDESFQRSSQNKLREQAKFLKAVLAREDNPTLLRVELSGFLSEWLSAHISEMSNTLKPYIARHIALNGPL